MVAAAEGTKRALALEDLKGIHSRTTVRRGQRGRHGKWAFGQLSAFIEYKAKLAGVPMLLVDPRDTSKRCSVCGHVERANRRTQACFRCRACGYELNADLNAAENIRWRADVMQPIVVCHPVGMEFELQAHDLSRGS